MKLREVKATRPPPFLLSQTHVSLIPGLSWDPAPALPPDQLGEALEAVTAWLESWGLSRRWDALPAGALSQPRCPEGEKGLDQLLYFLVQVFFFFSFSKRRGWIAVPILGSHQSQCGASTWRINSLTEDKETLCNFSCHCLWENNNRSIHLTLGALKVRGLNWCPACEDILLVPCSVAKNKSN